MRETLLAVATVLIAIAAIWPRVVPPPRFNITFVGESSLVIIRVENSPVTGLTDAYTTVGLNAYPSLVDFVLGTFQRRDLNTWAAQHRNEMERGISWAYTTSRFHDVTFPK